MTWKRKGSGSMGGKRRFPPANVNGAVDAAAPAPALPTPTGPPIVTPAPFFPKQSLFPFSRPPLTGSHYGSRLPQKQVVQALASVPDEPVPPAAESSAAGFAPPQQATAQPFAQPFAQPARFVSPQPPPAPPRPPERIVGPAQQSAAQSNEYAHRLSEREASRWGNRKEIIQPESFLVHAWAFALGHYPPSALTVWLQSTGDNPYSFYIRGDELAGDAYPDRKLYDTVRARRKRPQVAESFAGRIRGITAEGNVLDVGGGFIELPPEPTQQPAPWGPGQQGGGWGPSGAPAQAGPWGYGGPPGYGAPPGYGPPGMMGAPPWAQQWGPWGPPPWWHQYGQQGPPAQAPPAAIAHDPVAIELWKGMQEIQARSAQSSSEAQVEVAKLQNALMMKLIERAGQPATPAQGGGMREAFSMMKDALELVNGLRGDSGSDKGLHIHQVGPDKIFESGGKVNTELTVGFAAKDAISDLFKGFSRMRTPAAAAVPGVSAVGGGSKLPPKTVEPAAGAKPNGAT